MRREGPVLLGAITGIVVIISTYFTTQVLTTVKNEIDQWYLIAEAFVCLVGLINLSRIHFDRLSKKKPGAANSIALLVCMYGFVLFGLYRGSLGDKQYSWLYNTTVNPMSATVFSLLAFYIGSAAYRAFRVRTAEATVLLTAAVIMMLGRVPIGKMISPYIPQMAGWILDYPNTAGMRGITLGATLGGIATALRIMVGIERGHLGSD
jgi:hypothetical protein